MDTLETKQIKPSTLPFKCPNCGGYGTVGYAKKQCHSCEGKGIVFVPQVPNEEYEQTR